MKFEVVFITKLKRKGLMKWLEDKGYINTREEMVALKFEDFNHLHSLSSRENNIFQFKNIKINKLNQ